MPMKVPLQTGNVAAVIDRVCEEHRPERRATLCVAAKCSRCAAANLRWLQGGLCSLGEP